jgi:hypothetical protein
MTILPLKAKKIVKLSVMNSFFFSKKLYNKDIVIPLGENKRTCTKELLRLFHFYKHLNYRITLQLKNKVGFKGILVLLFFLFFIF